MDRTVWWAAVHKVAKSQTRLSYLAHTNSMICTFYNFTTGKSNPSKIVEKQQILSPVYDSPVASSATLSPSQYQPVSHPLVDTNL